MRSRDYRLDRAKGVLIFLVVLGHILAAVSSWESDVLRGFQTAIYSFHMPAFIFLAGITAKSERLAQRVLFFLVLLGTALPLYYGWMSLLGLDPDFDFLVPYWITWFLLSMAWWMLTVPLIERFPRAILVAALTSGLFGGIIPTFDYELAVARTLAFWPFFVVGKLYGKRILAWADRRGPAQAAGLVTAAAVPILVFYANDVSKLWFYGSRNFEWFDFAVPEGAAMRAAVGLSAALSTLALLACISNRDGYIATVGRHSLAVYLMHGFVVRLLNIPLGDSLDYAPSYVMIMVSLAIALGTTWLFTMKIFNSAIRRYGETLSRLILISPAKLMPAERVNRA